MTSQTAPAKRTMPQWLNLLKLAVFDVAGPLLVYRLAHNSGMSEVVSLVLSGIPPLVGVILEFAWKRRVEAIGVIVISGIALGALLALITSDPKLYLLEGAAKAIAIGLVFCGSALIGKPVFFYMWRGMVGGPDSPQGQWIDQQNAENPAMHQLLRWGTLALGALICLSALVSVLIVWKASTEVALTWNRIDFIPTTIIFTVMLTYWFHRAQMRGEIDFESMPNSKGEVRGEPVEQNDPETRETPR